MYLRWATISGDSDSNQSVEGIRIQVVLQLALSCPLESLPVFLCEDEPDVVCLSDAGAASASNASSASSAPAQPMQPYFAPLATCPVPGGADQSVVMQKILDGGSNVRPVVDLDAVVDVSHMLPIGIVYDEAKLPAIHQESSWMLPVGTDAAGVAKFLQWRKDKPWVCKPESQGSDYQELYGTYHPTLPAEIKRAVDAAWMQGAPGPTVFVSAPPLARALQGVFTTAEGSERLLAAQLLCQLQASSGAPLTLSYEKPGTQAQHPQCASKDYALDDLCCDLRQWLRILSDPFAPKSSVAAFLYEDLDVDGLRGKWGRDVSVNNFVQRVVEAPAGVALHDVDTDAVRPLVLCIAWCRHLLLRKDRLHDVDVFEVSASAYESDVLNALTAYMSGAIGAGLQPWAAEPIIKAFSDLIALYVGSKHQDVLRADFVAILGCLATRLDGSPLFPVSEAQLELLLGSGALKVLCTNMPCAVGFPLGVGFLAAMAPEMAGMLYIQLDAQSLNEGAVRQYCTSMLSLVTHQKSAWEAHDQKLRDSTFERSLLELGSSASVPSETRDAIGALFCEASFNHDARSENRQAIDGLRLCYDKKHVGLHVASAKQGAELSDLRSRPEFWHKLVGDNGLTLAHHAALHGNVAYFRWLTSSCPAMLKAMAGYTMFVKGSTGLCFGGEELWSVVHSAIAGKQVAMLHELLCVQHLQRSTQPHHLPEAVAKDMVAYLSYERYGLCVAMLAQNQQALLSVCVELGVCSRDWREWWPWLLRLSPEAMGAGFDSVQSVCEVVDEHTFIGGIVSDAEKTLVEPVASCCAGAIFCMVYVLKRAGALGVLCDSLFERAASSTLTMVNDPMHAALRKCFPGHATEIGLITNVGQVFGFVAQQLQMRAPSGRQAMSQRTQAVLAQARWNQPETPFEAASDSARPKSRPLKRKAGRASGSADDVFAVLVREPLGQVDAAVASGPASASVMKACVSMQQQSLPQKKHTLYKQIASVVQHFISENPEDRRLWNVAAVTELYGPRQAVSAGTYDRVKQHLIDKCWLGQDMFALPRSHSVVLAAGSKCSRQKQPTAAALSAQAALYIKSCTQELVWSVANVHEALGMSSGDLTPQMAGRVISLLKQNALITRDGHVIHAGEDRCDAPQHNDGSVSKRARTESPSPSPSPAKEQYQQTGPWELALNPPDEMEVGFQFEQAPGQRLGGSKVPGHG